MTTSAPPLMSSVAPCVDTFMSVESPESADTSATSLPRTPPASLISSIARPTPEISGGPRNARVPVIGSRVPTVSGSAEAAADDEVVVPVEVVVVGVVELQADSEMAEAARSARPAFIVKCRLM